MGRPVVRVVVLAVAAALVLLPALLPSESSAGAASPRLAAITDYRAAYVLTSAGTLVAQETLTADTASGEQGIARSWDVQDRTDSHARLNPEDVEVELDGKPVPFDLRWRDGRRTRVLTTLEEVSPGSSGAHVYTISYVVKGALSPAPDGSGSSRASRLVWDVVPRGWSASIAKATAQITLPAAAESVRCATGRTSGCTTSGTGTDRVTVRAGDLRPRTPVTVDVALPVEPPDRVTVPWPVRADRALGQSVPAVAAAVLLTVALAVAPHLIGRRRQTRLVLASIVAGAAVALLAIGMLWSPPPSIYLLPAAALALAVFPTSQR